MKKFFTIITIALCSTFAMAQTNQYFWANGQFIMGNPIDQIDSITYGQLEQTESITLFLPHTTKIVHDTVVQYVTVHDTVFMCDEHPYVDLGLSVKWATCNVGATKPEEYGDYFAWGETSTKSDYSWSTYKHSNTKLTKYCVNSEYGTVDNKTTLDKEDDAANVNWGGDWRMPTHAEQDELINNCTIIWTDNYNGTGVTGHILTSKIQGYTDKSIFLPAAGYIRDEGISEVGLEGEYWSSSLYTEESDRAWKLYFYSIIPNTIYTSAYFRHLGHPIRPVRE